MADLTDLKAETVDLIKAVGGLDIYDTMIVLNTLRSHALEGYPERFTPVWTALGKVLAAARNVSQQPTAGPAET